MFNQIVGLKTRMLLAAIAGAALFVGGVPTSSEASFPGRNGHLAWAFGGVLYRSDRSRTDRVALTSVRDFVVPGRAARSIAYSPDGERIAVVGHRRGDLSEVWIMRSDGSKLHQVTDSRRGRAVAVAFSPGGRRLVVSYAPTRSQEPDLYVVGTDGSGMRRLTSGETSDLAPQWAPNGRFILYSRYPRGISERGAPKLWTIRPDGTRHRLFAKLRTGAVDFMPGGRSILYLREGTIFRMNVRTRRSESIFREVDEGAFDGPIATAPNGSSVALHYRDYFPNGGCPHTLDIFRLEIEDARHIMCVGGDFNSIAWQPLPRRP